MRKIILNTNRKSYSIIKLNLKKFSDKTNLEKDIENFNLKFDKNVSYEEFKNQMDKNIDIALNSELANISNPKLLEILKEKGIDKTKEELDVLSKILSQKGKDTVS
jgi:hypothetical protein